MGGIGKDMEFLLTDEDVLKKKKRRRNCMILIGLIILTIALSIALILVFNKEQLQ